MIELILFAVCLYALKLFVLTFLNKSGLREWAQLKAPNEYYSKLFSCDFCLGFRILLILSLGAKLIYPFNWEIVFLTPMVVSGLSTLRN